ncbi:MAG: M23 family metallopeptidase [Candidatus Peribacteraceae bacterium]|nr:M23 family metallopeptidase [Candidatus Peribacteraceae bacterium]
MLRVEIDIPRPRETALLLLGVSGLVAWFAWGSSGTAGAVRAEVTPTESVESMAQGQRGGPDQTARIFALRDAEDQARRIRAEQAVLERREEILRYELHVLSAESASYTGRTSARMEQELAEAEQHLKNLLQDSSAAEERLHATLKQMWEAEGMYPHLASGVVGAIQAMWPVEPELGISATFLDAAYEKRFGLPHHAIDIPVAQGSDIRAAADGTVDRVIDNGLGYSYVIVTHEGFATLYGHVSAFYVEEGQAVRRGEVIAASGGMPGTRGAGALTTGPHLHFELIKDGKPVDPLTALPARPGVAVPDGQ